MKLLLLLGLVVAAFGQSRADAEAGDAIGNAVANDYPLYEDEEYEGPSSDAYQYDLEMDDGAGDDDDMDADSKKWGHRKGKGKRHGKRNKVWKGRKGGGHKSRPKKRYGNSGGRRYRKGRSYGKRYGKRNGGVSHKRCSQECRRGGDWEKRSCFRSCCSRICDKNWNCRTKCFQKYHVSQPGPKPSPEPSPKPSHPFPRPSYPSHPGPSHPSHPTSVSYGKAPEAPKYPDANTLFKGFEYRKHKCTLKDYWSGTLSCWRSKAEGGDFKCRYQVNQGDYGYGGWNQKHTIDSCHRYDVQLGCTHEKGAYWCAEYVHTGFYYAQPKDSYSHSHGYGSGYGYAEGSSYKNHGDGYGDNYGESYGPDYAKTTYEKKSYGADNYGGHGGYGYEKVTKQYGNNEGYYEGSYEPEYNHPATSYAHEANYY